MYWAFLNYLLNIIYNNHFLKVDGQFYEWEKILPLGENASRWEKSFSMRKTFLIEIIISHQEKPFFEKYFYGRKVSEWEKSFWLEEKFPGRRKKVSWC